MTWNRVATVVLVASAFACGGGGGSDDGDGEGTATESADDGMTNPTMPTASADDATGDDAPDGTGEPDCGNGIVEEFEDCDDGDAANSDTEPNACRRDCRAPWCGDGVHDDMTEECDDGGDNNDLEPNACRTTCALPICGDEVPDKGEACDDGNTAWGDSCFECASLYYFVLNAPDGGNDTITRSSRNGSPVLLVDDAGYDGMIQLALEPEGTTVYALQGGASNRVLFFDGGDGTLTSEADLGAVTPLGLARAGDGLVYVAVDNAGSTRLVTVDPATSTASEVANLGSVDVADMTAVGSESLLVTTGAGNSVVEIALPGYGTSNFAGGLSNPIGITYDPATQLVWVANNPGGEATIVQIDPGGTVTPFNPVAGYPNPEIHGVAIDTGMVVLATVATADTIVSIGILGGVMPFFTDMVSAPVDIEIVDLSL